MTGIYYTSKGLHHHKYILFYLVPCFLSNDRGKTALAFLFNKVVNLQYSEVQDRVILTGCHMVRDVSCKNCNSKLGWIYEFATEDSQRYKEGRVILERTLVRESEGFEEHVPSDNS
uniref:Protein yippee-like n=1 Tax=Bos indicus x Bos taurus TaxID=30522 RepID=A0A4W2HS25_BOBOX